MSPSCIVTGDTNLDKLRWNNPENGIADMVDDTKDEIETENFFQMVEGPTHFWSGHADSLIDQSWANKPGCVLSCRNIFRGTGDHNVIQTLYRTKGQEERGQEIIRGTGKSLMQIYT